MTPCLREENRTSHKGCSPSAPERADDGSFGPLQSRDRLPAQLQQRTDARAHRIGVRQQFREITHFM